MNFHRKRFLAMMDAIDAEEIVILILAHQDRLVRFGYEWFERFCEILVLNQEHLSPGQELAEDLLSVTQGFSARLDGLRNDRKSLKEALNAEVSPQGPAQSDGATDSPLYAGC